MLYYYIKKRARARVSEIAHAFRFFIFPYLFLASFFLKSQILNLKFILNLRS